MEQDQWEAAQEQVGVWVAVEVVAEWAAIDLVQGPVVFANAQAVAQKCFIKSADPVIT